MSVFTAFGPNDFIVNKLDIPNVQLVVSSTAAANASGVWVFIANSTSGGYLSKPDTSSNSSTNISISSAFRQISNYLFGTTTYIPNAFNNSLQVTNVRVISFGRPVLDEGLYYNTITASFSANLFSITGYDVANINSDGGALGMTGTFINLSNTGDILGTVFYDYGMIVLNGGSGSSSALQSSSSGFAINPVYNANELHLTSLAFQTRNILKRSLFFCRALNYQYNYTINPTARNPDGTIISSLSAQPTTFITTVGLYNDNGDCLAVGKLSTPQLKNFYTEVITTVEIDI